MAVPDKRSAMADRPCIPCPCPVPGVWGVEDGRPGIEGAGERDGEVGLDEDKRGALGFVLIPIPVPTPPPPLRPDEEGAEKPDEGALPI